MVHAEAGRTEIVMELISQGAPLDVQDQVTTSLCSHCHSYLSIPTYTVCMTNDEDFLLFTWALTWTKLCRQKQPSAIVTELIYLCLFVNNYAFKFCAANKPLEAVPKCIIPTPFLLTCTQTIMHAHTCNHTLTHTLHSILWCTRMEWLPSCELLIMVTWML